MATQTQLLPVLSNQTLLINKHTPQTPKTQTGVLLFKTAGEQNTTLTALTTGSFQKQQQPPNLTGIVKLLTDPHSAHLHERHLHALKKVCKHYQDGFIMKDLVSVFKILNVCADRLEEFPPYADLMLELLRLCSLPYLKEKSSDEVLFEQIAIECTDQLGYLMRVPSNELRQQICDTLKSFYTAKPSRQKLDKYKPTSQTFNQSVVEKSEVAETLVKSLALLDRSHDIKLSVLDLLRKLSKHSASNCNKMLRADCANTLCSHLIDPNDSSHQVLFQSIEILWNLIENGSREQIVEQLNNTVCISQLRDAFVQQMTQGFSHNDRQLRNDLLVIASLISSICADAPFVDTGFAKHIALFATFQEVKSHNVLVKHLKITSEAEDFELKKLLTNMLVLLSRDRSALPILSENRAILALFSYVKGNDRSGFPTEWSSSQFEEIQLHAMAALSTLAPLMLEDYMTCQGSTRLLLMLEWCTGTEDYSGFGNGFHSTGGYGSKRAQMCQCVRLIHSMMSTYDELVLADFTEQGGISQFISVLEMFSSKRGSSDQSLEDVTDIEIQSDLLAILSMICQQDIHRKELFGRQGIDVLVTHLKMDKKLITSGLGHFNLLLSAVNCTWCAVIGCYLTEDYFFEKEGVFLLLDLLESCPHSMRGQILGCLLDLAENQKMLPHFGIWRGKNNVSSAHLLCELWREEEQMTGVLRDSNGIILDSTKPLQSRIQHRPSVISLPANCPSRAIVDVSENLRAKIYAMFNKTGFTELQGLNTQDHVTLTVIEHYLDMKVGEVWTEVIAELNEEQIRPISPDREALEAISTAIHIRTEQIVEVQKELVEAMNQQDLIDEQEYFAEIRENHRQSERAAKNFEEFVSRTSKHMMLRAAKEKQSLAIDASRVQNNYKSSATFHSTDFDKLNITTFDGRNILASTIKENSRLSEPMKTNNSGTNLLIEE